MELLSNPTAIGAALIGAFAFLVKREFAHHDKTATALKESVDELTKAITGVRLNQENTKARLDNTDSVLSQLSGRLDWLEREVLNKFLNDK